MLIGLVCFLLLTVIVSLNSIYHILCNGELLCFLSGADLILKVIKTNFGFKDFCSVCAAKYFL
jgi:hypothetical protein